MLDLLQYEFMQRALVAGILVGILCPAIGIFLIMKRQSLIGDGLGHIAFAGVSAGWLLDVYPVLSATVVTVLSALGIEELRARRPAFADMILAIFFYTGIAVAIIFSSMMRSNNVNLISYLFGSIVTVTTSDVATITGLTLVVLGVLSYIFKELVYITFDEESAKVSGIPVRKINTILAVLTALTVSVSMRIVGILLVSALMVIPVAASLQISRSFRSTLINAIIISETAVISGLLVSFTANLATGGTIVIAAVAIFIILFAVKQISSVRNVNTASHKC
ncbi:metal ABC transporter permease [Dendrosporobacter sp. 1207_IL3150]|uniref:metal ABC transporter permease n=1 Tax=Dendrosporobacter sp. 1207_IL3150 TaxID=3084054 RepID=UPI002FD8E901